MFDIVADKRKTIQNGKTIWQDSENRATNADIPDLANESPVAATAKNPVPATSSTLATERLLR